MRQILCSWTQGKSTKTYELYSNIFSPTLRFLYNFRQCVPSSALGITVLFIPPQLYLSKKKAIVMLKLMYRIKHLYPQSDTIERVLASHYVKWKQTMGSNALSKCCCVNSVMAAVFLRWQPLAPASVLLWTGDIFWMNVSHISNNTPCAVVKCLFVCLFFLIIIIPLIRLSSLARPINSLWHLSKWSKCNDWFSSFVQCVSHCVTLRGKPAVFGAYNLMSGHTEIRVTKSTGAQRDTAPAYVPFGMSGPPYCE